MRSGHSFGNCNEHVVLYYHQQYSRTTGITFVREKGNRRRSIRFSMSMSGIIHDKGYDSADVYVDHCVKRHTKCNDRTQVPTNHRFGFSFSNFGRSARSDIFEK